MTEREREEQEYEAQAVFDAVAERFAGEFAPCVVCQMQTIDPFEHCFDKLVTAEYDEVAAHVARHGQFPPSISATTQAAITYDEDAFQTRVRECAYALAREGHA